MRTGYSTHTERWLDRYQELLQSEGAVKQLLLVGGSAVGKTFLAKELASRLTNGDKSRIVFVSVHPGYDYESFISGISISSFEGDIR